MERQNNSPADPLDVYFKHIREIPLLSRDEERYLGWRSINDNDETAQQELVEHNLRLVVSIAKKYRWKGLPFWDLIQAGNIGLIRSTKSYDPTFGYKFSTYATDHIEGVIKRELQNTKRTIRIPVSCQEFYFKVVKPYLAECRGQDVEPNLKGLARKVLSNDASEKDVKNKQLRIMALIKHFEGSQSQFVYGRNGDKNNLGVRVDSHEALASYDGDVVEQQDRLDAVDNIFLSALSRTGITKRDADIFMYRYGINRAVEEHTLEETGMAFGGLRRQRVHQICNDVRERLERDSKLHELYERVSTQTI